MSDTISGQVRAVGLELPAAAAPAANYVPFVAAGGLLFISGQLPVRGGERPYVGKLGDTISLEDGVKAAELCGLNLLAQLSAAVDDRLDRVVRCVRLGAFVNCTPEFGDQPRVVNGASDLMVRVLGERGRHARAAVGSNALPFGVAVEIEALFEIA